MANCVSSATPAAPPLPSLRLSTVPQMHAYAHPTRMSLLGLMAAEPLSLSGAGRHLGVHPANLTRHFRVLERAGLIRLAERRDSGRNVEKLYRAVAAGFVPDPQGLDPADKRLLALGALRDELGAAMTRVRGDDKADLLVLMSGARLKPEDRTRIYRTLEKLVSQVAARDNEKGSPYTLGLCLFPALHHAAGAKRVDL